MRNGLAGTAILFGLFLATLPISYALYGTLKPQHLTDREYIAKHRVLHGSELSDSEIIDERLKDEANSLLWASSNAILKAEKDSRGLGSKYWTLQDNVMDEILWFNEKELTVKQFVDKQYPESL